MKVLLVNPSYLGYFHMTAPLGVGYVGAAVKGAGYEVDYLDHTLLKEDPSDILDKLRPDCLGLTGLTPQYPGIKSWARIAKSKGVVTVAGGLHVSAFPEFTLEDCKDLDFVVKGEGEVIFPRLLKALETSAMGSSVPGLFLRRNGRVVGLPSRPIGDLDSLESPWSFLPLDTYAWTTSAHGISARSRPCASVITSRGCPYGCTFCAASQVQGKRIRFRSVEGILDELELLADWGIREVNILDDNFTFRRDHAYRVSQGMLDRGLSLTWTLPNGIRADRVDRGLLEKMKEAGCYYFGIGIESGSQRMLRVMKKGLDLEDVRRTTEIANSLGFITQGFFMVGHPEETLEDREVTLRFARSLPLDRVSVLPMIPFPGTELFRDYCENGMEPSKIDWSQMHWMQFVPRTTSRKELQDFLRRFYFRFYLNPIRLVRHLAKIRTFSQARGLFKGLGVLLRVVR